MKLKKMLALVMAILMMTLSLAACGQNTSGGNQGGNTGGNTQSGGEGDTDSGNSDVVIGVSFQGLSDEYIVRLSDAFQARADELGVKLQVADGQMDAETQVGQVENFIAQKVDAIVLNPISMDGCAPAVQAAKDAGIPIITLISITSN